MANQPDDYLVHFIHGKESGPWGSKIRRLADLARDAGFAVDSLDYAGIDDPALRVAKLVAACHNVEQRLILAGSSMGGWVAAAASARLETSGLFLMAPAFFLPGYAPVQAACKGGLIEIVHGWNDDIIPFEHSIRFGQEHAATLHLVDDGHRLAASGPRLDEIFRPFLQRVLMNA